ncbi:hypothetical protein HMI48_10540 [Acidithiobacillus ferrooxidans]|uniref:hypothetical protein n=1 Tax=Acidithiobacillus ferrooxidans TaxID=920 RepID=UPI001C0698AE|nr:hypothetical protein [Acidithiobacillus ferrooxidans]MBU2774300.1 hypothetical protein [Acidithiobacillus ferrooxidans]
MIRPTLLPKSFNEEIAQAESVWRIWTGIAYYPILGLSAWGARLKNPQNQCIEISGACLTTANTIYAEWIGLLQALVLVEDGSGAMVRLDNSSILFFLKNARQGKLTTALFGAETETQWAQWMHHQQRLAWIQVEDVPDRHGDYENVLADELAGRTLVAQIYRHGACGELPAPPEYSSMMSGLIAQRLQARKFRLYKGDSSRVVDQLVADGCLYPTERQIVQAADKLGLHRKTGAVAA